MSEPLSDSKASPLDIKALSLDLTAEEIVAAIRETRAREEDR
jgi:hypothetical protein